MMLLPDEMYRSKGRKYRITIGEPIPIDIFDSSKNDFEWAQDVRARVYNL